MLLTQASKLPGDTIRVSRTVCILVTRLLMAFCSFSLGVRSPFLLSRAPWKASSKPLCADLTGGKAGSANTMSKGT